MNETLTTLIENHNTIKLVVKNNPTIDDVAAQYALREILNNSYPQKQVVCSGYIHPYFEYKIDDSNAFLIDGTTTLAIVINAYLDCEVVRNKVRNVNRVTTLTTDPTLTSMSEVILDTFKELINQPLTAQINEFLFAGIVDATSQFKTSNVNAKTFETLASLTYEGMDTSRIIDEVMSYQ